jgi:uncharacterized SAM-binding protein YcdF (DUF218 family)
MLLPGMLILALVVGFGWFLHLATAPTQVPQTAEGIVAFTGGADRVATALRLLAEGNGRILLVSGAGTGTEFPSLARLAGVDPALSGRVTIGHQAATTHGNALETARWARQHDLRSLIVVTAFYHMPRAMAELSDALPGVALAPVAVRPRLAPHEELRLLISEYAKWLALQVGVSGDALRRDALPVEAGAADAARRGGG